MKLGVVYHMPFWRAPDGSLRELEGSFARYVDSLAPYFDEISLCVPTIAKPSGEGTAIRSSNVTLAALPSFEGPAQFYPKLPIMLPSTARKNRFRWPGVPTTKVSALPSPLVSTPATRAPPRPDEPKASLPGSRGCHVRPQANI